MKKLVVIILFALISINFGQNTDPKDILKKTEEKFAGIKDYTADVKITIFNILGQEICVLQNGMLNSGKYNIKFENNQISTGIYIANFKINSKIYNLKLSLIK